MQTRGDVLNMGVENFTPVTNLDQWQSFLGLHSYRLHQLPTWAIWLYFGIWILGIFFSFSNFTSKSRCVNPVFWLLTAVAFPIVGSGIVIVLAILSRIPAVRNVFTKERTLPSLVQKLLKGRKSFRISDFFEGLLYKPTSQLTKYYYLAPVVLSVVGRIVYEIYAAITEVSSIIHAKTATTIMLSTALLTLWIVVLLGYWECKRRTTYFNIYMNIPDMPRNIVRYYGRAIWEPSRNELPTVDAVRQIAMRYFSGQLGRGTGAWKHQASINNIQYLVQPLSETEFAKLRDFEYAKAHRGNITELCELHWHFDQKGNLLPESDGTPEKKLYWRVAMPLTTLLIHTLNAFLLILILYTPFAMNTHANAIAWFAEHFTNLFA